MEQDFLDRQYPADLTSSPALKKKGYLGWLEALQTDGQASHSKIIELLANILFLAPYFLLMKFRLIYFTKKESGMNQKTWAPDKPARI